MIIIGMLTAFLISLDPFHFILLDRDRKLTVTRQTEQAWINEIILGGSSFKDQCQISCIKNYQ